MGLSAKTLGFLVMGLLVSVLILAMSSMALYETNNNASESYSSGVKGLGGFCILTSLGVLLASPVVAGLRGKTLLLSIAALILCAFVITVSGMAIRETEGNTNAEYKDAMRAVSGTSLAASIIGIFVGNIFGL